MIREGNGVEQGDAAFFVPVRVGQEGDGQCAAAGRQPIIAFKPFAELFLQHGEGLCFIQPGMAPGGKFCGRQAVAQSLIRGERLSRVIDQQAVFQSELRGRPGDFPRAGIIGFRRKQILAAPHNGPQTGEALRIVPEQAFHVEAPDKTAHAAHEDSGHAEQAEQQRKGPANPGAGVAQDFLHGIPGQQGRIGFRDACPGRAGFLEKGRERLNLSLGQRKQRPVHIVGMSDVQGGQHHKDKNQEGEPQKEVVVPAVPTVHCPASRSRAESVKRPSLRSRSRLAFTRRT